MMTETQAQTNEVREGLVARWWMVAVAVLLTTFLPVLGLVWSLVLAFTQRHDRRVCGALLVVAGIALAYMVYLGSLAGVVG